jgi:hypothetical protein
VRAKSDSEWATKETALVLAFRKQYEGVDKANTRPPTAEQLDAQANPAYLQSVFDYMAKYGFFKTPYKYDELANDSFFEKVTK